MIDFSEDARALLELARDAHDPCDEDRARVRAVLASRIGVAAGLGAGIGMTAGLGAAAKTVATTAATAAAGASTGGGMTTGAVMASAAAVKLISAAVIVSATVGVGVSALVVHHRRHAAVARAAVVEKAPLRTPHRRPMIAAPARPAVPTAASEPPNRIPKAVPSSLLLTLPDSAKVPGRAHAIVKAPTENLDEARDRAPTRAARGSTAGVADETALVHAGVVALRTGNPARALALFDLHARTYPRGVLVEESGAERALALADLGRVTEARAAIDRFFQAYPDSPLVARLRERLRQLDAAQNGNKKPTPR